MPSLTEIAALLALIISLAGPGVNFWIARRKTVPEAQLVDAQTISEWNKAQKEMQGQINLLSDELSETRQRVVHLENDVSTLTRYLRRVINQLRAAGVAPDLPPEVLEQLFKGTQ